MNPTLPADVLGPAAPEPRGGACADARRHAPTAAAAPPGGRQAKKFVNLPPGPPLRTPQADRTGRTAARGPFAARPGRAQDTLAPPAAEPERQAAWVAPVMGRRPQPERRIRKRAPPLRKRGELEVTLLHEPDCALDTPAQPRADRAVRIPSRPGDFLRAPDRHGDPGMRPPGQLAVKRNQKFAVPVPRPRPSGGAGGLTNLQRSPARA